MRSAARASTRTPFSAALSPIAAIAKASTSLASTDAAPARAAAIATEAGARGEVEHVAAVHDLGAVEEIARQRLPAGPGEGPERRRQPEPAELLLGLVPELGRLVGKMEPDLGRVRDRQHPRVRPDEGGPVGAGHGGAASIAA